VPEQAGLRLVLATPSHVERLLVAHFAPEIAAEASGALPRARADLCARQGGSHVHRVLAMALLVLLPAELLFGFHAWAVVFLLLALVMCVAVLVRILATAMSFIPERLPASLPDAALPTYTVLVALYQETEVAASLVAAMAALDYPAAKLEVIYLVEADDMATWRALAAQVLPPHHRIVVVPDGAPRTKPRALNVGLMVARGERLVIYDAEDRPDTDQLRKAAARFHVESPKLAVLQACLRIENADDSWLTRLFALDYAAQFEILLPGLARLGLSLPLGGTSNHFRTDILRKVGGWDAWNVTEDADLGLRLARLGYRCETLGSFTLEEAPSTLRNWFPQRRRWLKGWMQTFLTHTRQPLRLVRDLGTMRAVHALALLASNTFGPAIGLWITFYVLHDSIAGELLLTKDDAWGRVVWVWVALAGFGVISLILPTIIAIVRVNLWSSAPWLLLRPLQWLCVSAAAFHALHELRVRPHHWSKTRHGLAQAQKNQSALVIEVASIPKSSSSVS
jgi:cellulose synthase/poly-beta-1,6-N-acetylglucosamine synthase-like glycosyltransferase